MLTLAFFLVALFYAAIGFGGGSSYLALLTAFNIPFEVLPKIALVCNILVVSGGCWHFYQKKFFKLNLILPFVLGSVPLALLGGMYRLSEKTFLILLGLVLLASGIRQVLIRSYNSDETRIPSFPIALLCGGLLGFLSGLVGLGGGIFLSPLILQMKWGTPKEAAATASGFIFLNSCAGLVGQMTKGVTFNFLDYWPLLVAVVVGGQIGSRIGTHPLVKQVYIQRATGVLILLVSGRLLWSLF
jgi:uncharacterized membrane protein YfcA